MYYRTSSVSIRVLINVNIDIFLHILPPELILCIFNNGKVTKLITVSEKLEYKDHEDSKITHRPNS